jgi:hypothetical protein
VSIRRFFTDLGESITMENEAGERVCIGRFGYWTNESGKNEVVANADSLEKLQTLYGDLPVYRIKEKK